MLFQLFILFNTKKVFHIHSKTQPSQNGCMSKEYYTADAINKFSSRVMEATSKAISQSY
jgi:hypothetical protein